jgi:hypothetical protein
MSSEISTESPAPGSESLQPWQLFTLAGLLGATLVVFLARGQSPAAVIILSLLVFAAAAVGLAAIRTFVPLAGSAAVGSTQILGGRTRVALEREKALVLRSIKELEFDRAMGKVSDRDFADMSARLRLRAGGLMRQLDAGTSYRDQIEQEVARRLERAGSASRDVPAGSASRDVPAGSASRDVPAGSASRDPAYADEGPADVGRVSRSRPACGSCNTANDQDAKFCKSCGAKLETA